MENQNCRYLYVEVTPESFDEMTATPKNETGEDIRHRVVNARKRQTERFKKT